MHKILLNAVKIRLILSPVSGFLIKGDTRGSSLLHPERPDMTAMRSRTADGEETVFIPGSSIKGVVRSAAERVLRSLAPDSPGRLACNPLDQDGRCHREASRKGEERSRGSRAADGPAHPMAEVHRMLCLACRTFGSQTIASRVRFTDAFPTAETREAANRVETRSGVSIDRASGGPSRGKLFETEVVTSGRFDTQIHMENVQLWQLALIGVTLQDIHGGLVRLGSAKTRGLGAFAVKLREVVFRQMGEASAPRGVGDLAPGMAADYGFVRPDQLASLPAGARRQGTGGVYSEWAWPEGSGWSLIEAAQGEPWQAMVQEMARGAGR